MNYVERTIENGLLEEQFNKIVSAFIIIYGRRRVGKTYFVRNYCQKANIELLEFTGLFDQATQKQLEHFIDRLNDFELEPEISAPRNWTKAFSILNKFIDRHFKDQKVVVFLDEVPWMDSGRSDFIAAVGDFWDNRIRNNPNKNLIVCGSAASYMMNKILSNKGPLHQRPTKVIEMKPFNLELTKKLLMLHGWHIQDKSICETYIAVGGVAKYLSDLSKLSTPEQAIHEACFTRNGKLYREYQELFHSLFKEAKVHYAIMDTLSQRWSGLTRTEITESINFSASNISKAINELVSSGFIEIRSEFNKKKRGERLLVSDMFCFFHHKWIKSNKVQDWTATSRGQSFRSWAGFAFERICQMHTYQIKKKLGIFGVPTASHYWEYRGNGDSGGAQIDLLLEHVNGSKNIDIIECKYYDGEFTITKDYYEKLQRKRQVFDEQTGKKYNIRLVIVTTDGVAKNQYFNALNANLVCLSDLFSSEP
jgi:AAA+ ATPase superfamily predicted ATPase